VDVGVETWTTSNARGNPLSLVGVPGEKRELSEGTVQPHNRVGGMEDMVGAEAAGGAYAVGT
jgi:hypothetical protein